MRLKTPFVDWLCLVSMFFVLAAMRHVAGQLPCTGDEPRYAFQGVGLYTTGGFYPKHTRWERFATQSGCGNGGVLRSDTPGRPLLTVSPSVIFGPALQFGGLEAARWLDFVVGCSGLALLYFVLASVSPNQNSRSRFAALGATAAIAFSVPFAPYLQLIYPEMLLFTAIAAALYGLLVGNRYATLFALVVLPFLHIRTLPLSLTFFAILLYQAVRDRTSRAQVWKICALYVAGLGVFAVTQYWLYGSLTGSAFPTYHPSAAMIFERLGMQFYDVRHGAIAYAPLLLVGLAGLALGTIRRDRFSLYSLLLFATYFATFMWSTANESWTARFWVAGLPFLAVGLAYWLRLAKQWWEWLPIAPLAMLDLFNVASYVIHPLWFLESRQSSISYAALFRMSHVDLGLFLPVDATSGSAYTQPIGALLVYTALVIVFLVSCRMPRSVSSRAISCALTFAVLAAPLVLGLARSLPATTYSVAVLPWRAELVVHLKDGSQRIDALQFDKQLQSYWTSPPYPAEFTIRCIRASGVVQQTTPAYPMLVLEGCSDTDTLEITGTPASGNGSIYRSMGTLRLIQRIF